MKIYEQRLSESLARANLSGPQIQAILVKFNVALSKGGDPKQTMIDYIESYASESPDIALRALETANAGWVQDIVKQALISYEKETGTKILQPEKPKQLHFEVINPNDARLTDNQKANLRNTRNNESHAGVAQYHNKSVPMALEIVQR